MNIMPLNVFSLPFALGIWAADSCLFIVALRLLLPNFPRAASTRAYGNIRGLTDPMARKVEQWLQRQSTAPVQPWKPWLVLVLGLMACRYILFCMLAAAV